MAVGTTLYTYVLLDNESFGKEIHVALGTSSTANVSSINRLYRAIDTLTYHSPDFQLDKLPFKLHIVNADNVENQFSEVDQILSGAPSFIVISGSANGKWYWPINKMNIGLAYPQFNVWGNNMVTAPNWYDEKNAASGKVLVG